MSGFFVPHDPALHPDVKSLRKKSERILFVHIIQTYINNPVLAFPVFYPFIPLLQPLKVSNVKCRG